MSEEIEKYEEKSLAEVTDPVLKSLIKNCDPEIISEIHLTPEELKDLRKYAIMVKYGDHNMIPMICQGPRCIARSRCPLVKHKKTPVGKECVFERFALSEWRDDYVSSLNIDENDKIERQQILDLVEADILNARANVVLGEEGFIMENPVGTDPTTGEPITRKEEHIALKLKERAQNRKDRILKAFLATREQKLKALATAVKDPTEYMSELKARAEKVFGTHEKAIDATVVPNTDEEKKKVEEPKKKEEEAEDNEPF